MSQRQSPIPREKQEGKQISPPQSLAPVEHRQENGKADYKKVERPNPQEAPNVKRLQVHRAIQVFFPQQQLSDQESADDEKYLNGTVDLKAFYVRRLLRIWP